jgi:hypothetical protein
MKIHYPFSTGLSTETAPRMLKYRALFAAHRRSVDQVAVVVDTADAAAAGEKTDPLAVASALFEGALLAHWDHFENREDGLARRERVETSCRPRSVQTPRDLTTAPLLVTPSGRFVETRDRRRAMPGRRWPTVIILRPERLILGKSPIRFR